MLVGVPKEIKSNEFRVALTPDGARTLVEQGHQVLVEHGAGAESGFEDSAYLEAGARIQQAAEPLWDRCDMIMKVKEPLPGEYGLMREGQTVFTYFHFAASRELTEAVIRSGCVALAYETIQKADGTLPLLVPMSEVAGRMAVQEGAKYLERPQGGRGCLLGGIPGVRPATVLVIGGGVVGSNAARIAAGMGARVILMDINPARLRYLDETMPANVTTIMSSDAAIREWLAQADLVIGALLIPGARAPRVITRPMLGLMRPRAVLVDVAIDQGGCFETSRATTHDAPIYEVDGIVHYAVANMPGAVPYTSTLGLTNVTLPYAVEIANRGWREACQENPEIARGLNIAEGQVLNRAVAEAFDLECPLGVA